jgi:hypothetical protein
VEVEKRRVDRADRLVVERLQRDHQQMAQESRRQR